MRFDFNMFGSPKKLPSIYLALEMKMVTSAEDIFLAGGSVLSWKYGNYMPRDWKKRLFNVR